MKNPANLQFNVQSDIGDAAESIPAKMRRSKFQGAYGLAVSSLALLALSSNLCRAYASNLVMLDSECLGDGIFEYRLTCNLQPYLERSGLSNFSLSFPGFDGVVQEAVNWQRGPGFPTPPQAEASLEEVITYCGGGYSGAFSLFVLYELGYENIRLYDGSWLEWVSKGGASETGP